MHPVPPPTQRETLVRVLLDVRNELTVYRIVLLALMPLGSLSALIVGVSPPGTLPARVADSLLGLFAACSGGLLLDLYLGRRKASRILRAHGIVAAHASLLWPVLTAQRMISSAERNGILEGRPRPDRYGRHVHDHRVVCWRLGLFLLMLVPLGVVWILIALAPDLSLGEFNAIVIGSTVLAAVTVWLVWWRGKGR